MRNVAHAHLYFSLWNFHPYHSDISIVQSIKLYNYKQHLGLEMWISVVSILTDLSIIKLDIRLWKNYLIAIQSTKFVSQINVPFASSSFDITFTWTLKAERHALDLLQGFYSSSPYFKIFTNWTLCCVVNTLITFFLPGTKSCINIFCHVAFCRLACQYFCLFPWLLSIFFNSIVFSYLRVLL